MSLKTIIAGVAVVLLAGAGAWFIFSPHTFTQSTPTVSNPFGETTVPINTNQKTGISNPIRVQSNTGQMDVKDFTKGAGVVTDATTSVSYFVHLVADKPEYEINYLPDHTFYIGLFSEPIGKTRKTMTDDLVARLGITSKELCSLSARVAVPEWVNPSYSGKNLGFAGCPGATVLPDN